MGKDNRLEMLKKRILLYYEAEEAILSGAQSYSLGSRSLTRANLSEIKEMIDYLEKEISSEEAKAKGRGRMKVSGGVPRDV